jgi:phage repressor protein C with HTH and peptisase S24 domain
MTESKRPKITDEHREEAARLKALWDERPHRTQAEFGEHYGLGGQANVGHYLLGRSSLNAKAAMAFSTELGIPVSDFSPRVAAELGKVTGGIPVPTAPPPVGVPISSRDDPPEGYVRLQHLSPQPSMGHGSAICEPVEVVRHLDVLENWVHQKVGSANYDRIKILTGCGQSMRPTIQDQDLVFVDISQRFIDIPGIYVIDVCGRFLLKRALILSDGTLVLKSDNTSEFPDEEKIDLRRAADSINVAGRVKAWWTLHQG